jgi:trimeric autotransporter adhesin
MTLPRAPAVLAPTARSGLASLPALAQGSVSAALGRDEPAYRVRGLLAVNPAQHFRVGFSRRNVTVAAGRARIAMTLLKYGYASALRTLAPVTPHVSANRVSYTHGSLTEWFANGPLGLEQAFDLTAPPRAGEGPLTFSMAVSGSLEPRLRRGSLLLSGGGASLRYSGLVATDARGRVLRSWLQLVGHDVLMIRVNDHGAVYPLRIDPFIQQGEVTASRGVSGEEFGESVTVSGRTIVVGTPNYVVASDNREQGAAYVFTMPAPGSANATQTARLTAAKGQSEELFGASVSIAGDTIVVGAPFREVARHTDQGAAYVFVKPASGWRNATPTAKLTAAGGAVDEFFGESVAISGRTIVVGAPSHKVGKNAMQGTADVFTRPASGWSGSLTQKAQLTASDGQADDALGISVAISSNAIVAGADRHAVGKNADQGAGYVFVKPALGWTNATQTAELTAGNGAASEFFGEAVGVSGNTIVAGAPEHQVGKNAGQGAVYVFVMPASGWGGALSQKAELTASDGAKNEVLGRSLAVSGNVIATGARFREVGKSTDQGAVYVFVKPSSGWANVAQTVELTASNGTTGDSLGRSIAVAGDTIIAGAPDHAVGRNLAQGSVYAFGAPR